MHEKLEGARLQNVVTNKIRAACSVCNVVHLLPLRYEARAPLKDLAAPGLTRACSRWLYKMSETVSEVLTQFEAS